MNRARVFGARVLFFLCILAPITRAGTVTSTVTNGTNGKPAAGVQVILIQLQGGMQPVDNTKTDANGHYQFANQHGHLAADAGIRELVMAIRVGLRIVHRLHAALDKSKNLRAIAYAFRPGENEVRISYKLPYPGNETKLRIISPYLAGRLVIATPPTVQIAADGLVSAAPEQGFSIYMHDSVAANAPVNVTVSGTAAPPPQQGGASGAASGGAQSGGEVGPPAAAGNTQNPSVNSRLDESGAEAPTTAATTMPARLDSLKWILVVGFAAIFALGFVFLWRRPQMMSAAATITAAGAGSVAVAIPPTPIPSRATSNAEAAAVAEADSHVRGGLDELKDTLFRLELRRQAGTIADDDYARERQRIEQLLRDLVRG